MAPEKLSRPLPAGWTHENEVLKDDKRVSYYYCKATGQQFSAYDDLMRYVKYAKQAKVGIYSPDFGSNKRKRKERKDSTGNSSRKEISSSSSDNCSNNSPSESVSSRKEDPDYIPAIASNEKADPIPIETEEEVASTAKTNEEFGDEMDPAPKPKPFLTYSRRNKAPKAM